jgi:formiminoglutamase
VFTSPDRTLWQGRVDAEDGAAGLRWHQRVQFEEPSAPAIGLLGFPCDLGVRRNRGRPGAAGGPAALRAAMANLAWHHRRCLYDAGDVAVADDLSAAQDAHAGRLADLLAGGHFVIGLGGGHEIGWAGYMGCRRWLDSHAPGKVLGILNFDAHFDLREPAPHPSSGTPFYQVARDCAARGSEFRYACLGIARPSNTAALFARAADLSVSYLADSACRDKNSDRFLGNFLARIDYLYLTFCLDVLPSAHAPGVSAPAAIGVDPRWALRALAFLGSECARLGVHWLTADIAELAPALDADQRTARLGARLIDEMLAARFSTSTA